ncbi:MAG: PQQ-binding-like beta-propeller repeat protein [Phycisphaerae bacterium]
MRLINRFVVVALTILSIAPVVRADAPNIAADAGISTGVCLWLGAPSLEQLKALAKDGRILTRVLAPEPQVAALRARLQECGIYGLVTVTPRPQTPALPMVSNTVDLIIATEQLTEGSRQEAIRILRPRGMLATPEGARFAFTPKPMPATMDEWRNKHHREDSQGSSRDAELTAPFELRWQDGPIFGACRYGDYLPTALVAGGRMYSLTPCDVMNLIDLAAPEYHLVARNAFNGVRLWSIPFPAGRSRSELAACGDRLFVPFDDGWRALDGETGNVVYAISDNLKTVKELVAGQDTVYVSDAVWPKKFTLRALAAADGKLRWSYTGAPVSRVMLDGGRVFLMTAWGEQNIIGLDGATGRELFRVPIKADRLVLARDGLLLVKEKTEYVALDAATGAERWRHAMVLWDKRVEIPPFWWKGGVGIGQTWVNPVTGKEEGQTVARSGSNCIGALNTDLFTFNGRGEILTQGSLSATPAKTVFGGLRGLCGVGTIAACGQIFATPSICVCVAGRAPGFAGFGTARAIPSAEAWNAPRPTIKGTAASLSAGEAAPTDWPVYRQNLERTGATSASAPASLSLAWRTMVATPQTGPVTLNWLSDGQSTLTPPTLAGGLVYVAEPDGHCLRALDAATGAIRWSFTADGRIDSPPTLHKGSCVFGCRDGWVYALSAADGQLLWKTRAAPEERWIVNYGQIESAYAVSGSVVVEDGKVSCVSGISSSIDAGIAYCVFSLADGKFLSARPGTGLADLLTRSKTGLYHRATYAGELPKPRGGSSAIVPAERGGFFSAYASVAPMPMEMPRVDTITRQNFGPAKGMLIGHDAAGICTYNYIAKERKQIPAFISYWSLPTPAPAGGEVPETWRFTYEPASNLPLRTNGVRLLAIALAADAVVAAGFDPAQPAAQRGFVHIYNRADGRRRAAATFADTPTFDGLAVTAAGITLATESGAVLHFR